VEFNAVNGMAPAAATKLGRRIAAAARALGRAVDFHAVGHPSSGQEDDP
jgi:hypothetical protein